jgi:hypothetical protein
LQEGATNIGARARPGKSRGTHDAPAFSFGDGRDVDLRVTALDTISQRGIVQRSVTAVGQDIDGQELEVLDRSPAAVFARGHMERLTSNRRTAASVRLFPFSRRPLCEGCI